MPIALDPNAKFPYVFSTDRTQDLPNPPKLWFHFATCQEVSQIATAFEEADAKGINVNESVKKRCDAMRLILCGWENLTDREGNTVPYDPAKLEQLLTDTDLSELKARLIRDMSMNELEKKRAAFSSLSDTASSAKPAAAESA